MTDGPDLAALVAELEQDKKVLGAKLDALGDGDQAKRLAREIELRFGFERRLQMEMAASHRLQAKVRDLEKREKRQRALLTELAGLLGCGTSGEIAARVRALVEGR